MEITEFLRQIPFINQLPQATQVLMTRLILLALALIVIWILRNIVTRILMQPIKLFVGRTSSDLDDNILDAVQRPLRVAVLGLGIAIVSGIFSFGEDLDTFADSLASALILAAFTFFVYNLVEIIAFTPESMKRITGLTIQDRLLPFFRTVVKVFIVVMGALIIIQEFGYDITGLIASFGVVGLAFSLAAQDTAANVFGFTAIVSDNPFKVDDYIVTSDFAGIVEQVGVRSTRVRKLDQSLVTVPNNTLTNAPVTNWSRLSKRRLDFYIGVTYDTNSAQMRSLLDRLREMLKARETVDPESVMVYFVEFGNSALQIRIIAYILLADWGEWTAETELINLEIMDIVDSLGLSIAFPSRSLYIETLPEMTGQAASHTSPEPLPIQRQARPLGSDEHVGQAEAKYQDNPSASTEEEGDSA